MNIPSDRWLVVKVNSNKHTEVINQAAFFKPADMGTRNAMVAAAKRWVSGPITEPRNFMPVMADALYVFVCGDELHGLLKHKSSGNEDLLTFASFYAGAMSSVFSLYKKTEVAMEAEVYAFGSEEEVCRYFEQAQLNAYRRCLDAYCFWVLYDQGVKPKNATKKVANLDKEEKLEVILDGEVDWNSLPSWQCVGTGVYLMPYVAEEGASTSVPRMTVVVDGNLGIGEGHSEMLGLLFGGESRLRELMIEKECSDFGVTISRLLNGQPAANPAMEKTIAKANEVALMQAKTGIMALDEYGQPYTSKPGRDYPV